MIITIEYVILSAIPRVLLPRNEVEIGVFDSPDDSGQAVPTKMRSKLRLSAEAKRRQAQTDDSQDVYVELTLF